MYTMEHLIKFNDARKRPLRADLDGTTQIDDVVLVSGSSVSLWSYGVIRRSHKNNGSYNYLHKTMWFYILVKK